MGVQREVALLLIFTLGAHATFWYWYPSYPSYKCPIPSGYKDPRVCGSDGITYESSCVFNIVRYVQYWLKILYYGPCKTSTTQSVQCHGVCHYSYKFQSYKVPTDASNKGDTDKKTMLKSRQTAPEYLEVDNDYYDVPTRRLKRKKTTPIYLEGDYESDDGPTRRPTTPVYSDEDYKSDFQSTWRPSRKSTTPAYSYEENDDYNSGQPNIEPPQESEEENEIVTHSILENPTKRPRIDISKSGNFNRNKINIQFKIYPRLNKRAKKRMNGIMQLGSKVEYL